MKKKELVLYSRVTCPYCIKVLIFASLHGFNLKVRSTFMHKENQNKLKQIGGKTQIPCLVVDGVDYLYESNDIIRWLRENKDVLL